MMKYNSVFLLILLMVLISCAGSSRKVSRVQADMNTEISGRWNDTDSRLTAESMIRDMLSKTWLIDFSRDNGRKPFLIVGKLRNKSSEHIAVTVLVKDIERELVNSGQVSFVASAGEREAVRDERMDQQSYSSLETAKELANEQAADFMLQGTINSIVDQFEGERVVFYQIDLELVDLESNTKVWLGDKKIKKVIEQDKYKW